MYSKKMFIIAVAAVLCLSVIMVAGQASAAAYPDKNKTITLLNGSGVGGSSDLFSRLLAKCMEKQLGANIEVVNKPGAGTQFAMQAVSTAKPDGYTVMQMTLPTGIMIYLDPQKKAQFDGKSFAPIDMQESDPGATAVSAKSPYKTMKDLIDAAKANPGKIKFGAGSKATRQHLDCVRLEQAAGVKFQQVHAGSDANPVVMLMGGHLDVVQESVGDFENLVRSGELRMLGVWDDKESPMAPGVKTMKAQGLNLISGNSRGLVAPAGTPDEIIKILDSAIKKAMDTAEFKDGMEKLKQPARYMNQAEYIAYWKEMEASLRQLMPLVLK
jgi:tripartite-type tricarboxylate transporter receptor subunit TctC